MDYMMGRPQEMGVSGAPRVGRLHHYSLVMGAIAAGAAAWMGTVTSPVWRVLRKRTAQLSAVRNRLRRSEAGLRELVEAANDIISTLTPEGTLVSLNAAFERVTGWPRADWIGKSFNECVHSEDHGKAAKLFERVKQGEHMASIQLRLRSKNLGYIPVEFTGSAQYEKGELVRVLSIGRDMTERIEAERKLQFLNEHLEEQVRERTRELELKARELEYQLQITETITTNTTEGLCLLDAEARLTYVNPAAEQVLGWTRSELLGKVLHEVGHYQYPDGRPFPQAECPLTQVLRDGTAIRNCEDWWIRKDGTVLTVTCSYQPIVQQAEVLGAVVSVQDVTDRKVAEEKMQETASILERSNKDLEQFAYMASHDLQEPLRMISSYLGLLKERYDGQLDDKADEFIGYAVDGAARMKHLINDLLNYSRVAASSSSFGPVDCGEVLQSVLRNLKLAVDESGAVIKADPLPVVTGERAHLEQLFQNLLGNAIKYRSQHRPEISIHCHPTEGMVRFEVRDNGIGFEEKFADRIFELFRRLHARDQYPGTGVGLALCKKIVERHGGRIWADAQPGVGARFSFELRPNS
jgi:PAS domain S-box-containing protein